MPAGQHGKAARAGTEIEHAFDACGIADQRSHRLAAEMGFENFPDEGFAHDHAAVDIEGQAAL